VWPSKKVSAEQDGDFQFVNKDIDSSFDDETVTQSQVQVKTVILAPDCQLSDEVLMQENETIANPTNKKIKAEITPKKEALDQLITFEQSLRDFVKDVATS